MPNPAQRSGRTGLALEAAALAASLAAIPPLSAVAGAVDGLHQGAGVGAVALVIVGFGALAARACRGAYHAAVAGDPYGFAHHSAYPLGLGLCLLARDEMIITPFALGFALA